jgi:hypothetical protein
MAGTWADQHPANWYDKAGRRREPHGSERNGDEERRPNDVPSWSDVTPSGIRRGVDEAESNRIASRQRQNQQVGKDEKRIRVFSWTQFIGHVSDKITFNKNGDMIVQVVVPYQFKHLAEPLTDAFGIPLSFDVEVWKPYTDANATDTTDTDARDV